MGFAIQVIYAIECITTHILVISSFEVRFNQQHGVDVNQIKELPKCHSRSMY